MRGGYQTNKCVYLWGISYIFVLFHLHLNHISISHISLGFQWLLFLNCVHCWEIQRGLNADSYTKPMTNFTSGSFLDDFLGWVSIKSQFEHLSFHVQFLPVLPLSIWDRLLGNVNLVKSIVSINPSIGKKTVLIWNSEQGMKQNVNRPLSTLQLGKNKIEINTEIIIPNEISFPGMRWGPKLQVLQKMRMKI